MFHDCNEPSMSEICHCCCQTSTSSLCHPTDRPGQRKGGIIHQRWKTTLLIGYSWGKDFIPLWGPKSLQQLTGGLLTNLPS